MTTTTAPITVTQRMAAQVVQRDLAKRGQHRTARLIEDARQAESFPASYTADAVKASEAVIRACALEPVGTTSVRLLDALRRVTIIQTARGWYRQA